MSRAKLEQLGYSVGLARPETDDGPAVYVVDGFGLRTYVPSDDTATWAVLANVDAHAHRKWQAENADADPLDVAERSIAVAVKLGELKATEAAALRAHLADERAKRDRP